MLYRRTQLQKISQLVPACSKGKIFDLSGREVGEHLGLMYYTLGQRRGLDLGGIKGEEEQGRWFVVKKDLAHNVLYVSHGDESPLYSQSCEVSGFNWIPFPPEEKEFECAAKFRYRQPDQKVKVTRKADRQASYRFLRTAARRHGRTIRRALSGRRMSRGRRDRIRSILSRPH